MRQSIRGGGLPSDFPYISFPVFTNKLVLFCVLCSHTTVCASLVGFCKMLELAARCLPLQQPTVATAILLNPFVSMKVSYVAATGGKQLQVINGLYEMMIIVMIRKHNRIDMEAAPNVS